MEPRLNPYRPGAGLQPPELAGRARQVACFDNLILRSKYRTIGRPVAVFGLRGVGKTALINRMAAMAESQNWVCVSFEGQTSTYGQSAIRKRLSIDILTALKKFSLKHRLKQGLDELIHAAGSFSLELGPVAISREIESTATGVLDIDVENLLTAIAREAQNRESGFGIFVDELQDADTELMGALLSAQHKMQQLELPFYLVTAGLPNTPAVLSEVKSYAERLFDYQPLGPLAYEDTVRALQIPADRYSCSFTEAALRVIYERSAGYPYFIQEYGKATWDLAADRVFTEKDALEASAVAERQLDHGLYAVRWARASDAERAMMREVASREIDSLPSGRLPIWAQPSMDVVGRQLLAKGLLYCSSDRYEFTVPGMGAFVRRAAPQASTNEIEESR